MKKKISSRVISRISFYYEALLKLNLPENAYVSSKKLEDVTGVSCNQVRQDFFYLGISIGKQKKGYQVQKLFQELKKILSIDRGTKVIIIGAGRIGQALSNYKLFNDRNITVTALFDIKEGLVGSEIGKPGRKKPVLHVNQLDTYLQENPDIQIALLTVPEEAAQETMDKLIGHGIKGIVNFAPKILKVPKEFRDVQVINDCIGTSLYKIVYQLYHKK
ncbi:MAG: redox-sensing transcriptional repressor Rex [Candidatus Aminicenantes bacterium]|nr:redox-sensing transcriptional repressor Rex [Candidatus Aminicenantes bacterium]